LLGRFEYDRAASWRGHHFEQAGDHPVVDVNWNDAKRFCDWLTRREGRLYRLPTEAEWEYCCRAGTKTAFSSGDDPRSLEDVANLADAAFFSQFGGDSAPPENLYVKNSGDAALWNDGFVFTAPVGTLLPNGFAVHDMHGNVAEWCDADFAGAKIVRGGSFFSSPAGVRSAQRYWHSSRIRRDDLGFRVVADGADPISKTPVTMNR
ncbi:MAG TPA: SUMF1/EgtB/PvdO family nonheme iron enzyme, partial [Pirellulales bacterium]|nr:SUMF1/EgtB/PvdO family nonheme iron enzyme [Pirellulales bacterium]